MSRKRNTGRSGKVEEFRRTGDAARLVLILVVLVSGCGSLDGSDSGAAPAAAGTPTLALPEATAAVPSPVRTSDDVGSAIVLARSERQRETSPEVPASILSKLSAGNNAFAFDLYQAVREADGNLFFSPYSISAALAMTYAGARSNTERQMAETLHYTLQQEQLHPVFNALDLSLSGGSRDAEGFELSITNSLWGQAGYSFLPGFLDTLAGNYGAGLRLVDFVSARQREQARLAINDWVGEQTKGKVEELLVEGILTKLTRLVLANAIYFKAEWKMPFLNGTKDAPFTLLNGEEVTVPMMSRRATTSFSEGEAYQAVELLYKGDRVRMLVLLPVPGQFESFEGALDAQRLDSIVAALSRGDINLFLPKYEYMVNLSLAKTLADMGMPDAFDAAKADFSGMNGNRELLITQVEHKAFVAVNERGTEAAAATAVIVERESVPMDVNVNRPFIFVIRDVETGTILLVGRVLDPSFG
jgi:serpin B